MVEGVVLAAGSSSRAGCFKMELPLGDKTLIERSIEGMYNVCSRIIVVGGFRIERVREILRGYSKVEVVENANWQRGMFNSVKAGVSSIREKRFFLLPADIPFVTENVYQKMLSISASIVVPTCNGKRGHPILLSSEMKKTILNEPDDSNLGHLTRRVGFRTVEVGERRILRDVDTLEDWREVFRVGEVVALTGIEPVFEP